MVKKVKETEYLKLLVLVTCVSFSCLCVAIISDFMRSEPITSYENLKHIRWMLWKNIENETAEHQIYKRNIVAKTNYPIVITESYLINNKDICSGVNKVSCVVMVHTAPLHLERRVRMRATWLNSTHYSPKSVRVVFLFGLVSDESLQLKIETESKKYKDIVQGKFIDSYRNLTNKGVMGFKWISEHCRNAEFVVKIDDDAFVNFFKLFEEMSYLKEKKRVILCNKIDKGTMKIIRQNTSKWFVDHDEFKEMQRYPHTYCSGFAVFMSTDLVHMLYHASILSPFFWVDDFYLFGLLPSNVLGVTHETIGPNLTFSFLDALDCYQTYGKSCQYLVMPAKDMEIIRMWIAVTKDRLQSIYGNYYLKLPLNLQKSI